jgi:hypothetical protein
MILSIYVEGNKTYQKRIDQWNITFKMYDEINKYCNYQEFKAIASMLAGGQVVLVKELLLSLKQQHHEEN